jgi:RHS repeat-associated protein
MRRHIARVLVALSTALVLLGAFAATPTMATANPHISQGNTVTSAGIGSSVTVAPGVTTTSLGGGRMRTVFSGAAASRVRPRGVVQGSSGALTTCQLTSAAPTTSSCGTSTLQVGWNGSAAYRALIAAPSFFSAVPRDVHIIQAQVQYTSTSISPAGANATVQSYPVTRAWSSPSWNQASTGTAWTTPGGDLDTTTTAYQAPGYSNAPSGTFFSETVTQLVSDWVSGATTNNGILIKEKAETTSYLNTISKSSVNLALVWSNNLGNRSSSSPLTRQLTDQLSISANDANGNLAVQGSLLNLAGVGQHLSLGYAINGTDIQTITSFDYRSLALLNQGSTPDQSLSYTQPDGQTQPFIRSGPTTYQSPRTLNATLSVDAALTTWKLRFNDTGITNSYSHFGTALTYQLDSSTDTNGNTISYNYNTNGQLTSITDTQGRTINLTYTTNLYYPTSITDTSTGRSASISWSTAPGGGLRIDSVTDLAGKTTSFGYDSTLGENLVSITDPDGHVTSIAASNPVNAFSRVNSITFGSGSSSPSTYSWAYPSFGTTKLTDPNGGITTYTYDSGDRVTNTLDPLGHTTASSWSPANKPMSRTDGLSQVTNYHYNGLDSLDKITSPAGTGTTRSASYSYPGTFTGALSDYQPTSSKDAQGNTTSYTYNAQFQLATSPTPGGAGGTPTNHYQGDSGISCTNAKPGELCSKVDGNGHTTSYSYDTAGNPTTITAPSPLGTTTYTYDGAGRQTSKTDGRGTATYTTYDALDRITQVSSSASSCPASCISYTYNAEGWLTQRVDPSGTTSYTYDAQGRPLTKNTPTGNTSQSYDGNGNLASYTDAGGTVGYRYDAANRVIALWEAGGSCPATPAYPNSTKCTGFGYDNGNRRTSVSYPNGQTIALGYDTGGRETSVVAKNHAGTVLSSRTYNYEAGTADTDLRHSVTDQAGVVTSYSYDPLNRLLSSNNSSLTQSFTYDHNGNRLTSVFNGTTTYAAFNAADELCNTAATSGGTCSAPVSGATSYTYNGSGDLLTGGSLTSATYSTFDQTASSTSSGVTTNNTYSDIASDERTTSGSASFVNGILGLTRQTVGTTSTEFVRDPNGMLVAAETSAGSYYYTADALGSVILMTDSSGASAAAYTYGPWGDNGTATGTFASSNPFRYAGGYTDANGFVKFGTRYYKPGTGVFTQQDPAGQGPNFYAYAGDNPISNNDPSGRGWGADIGSWVGGAAGVLAGAAICAGTAGVGCIVGAAFAGAALTTAGGLLGAGLSNETVSGEEVTNWAVGGAIGGAAGGVGGLVDWSNFSG